MKFVPDAPVTFKPDVCGGILVSTVSRNEKNRRTGNNMQFCNVQSSVV